MSVDTNALFIFDDPFGQTKLNSTSYSSYCTYSKTLINLANAKSTNEIKFLFTCAKEILNDERVKGIVKENSRVIDIKMNSPIQN